MTVTLPLCAVTLMGAVALSSCDQKANTTEQTTEPVTEAAAAPAPDYSAEIKEHNDAPMVFDAEQFTIQNPRFRSKGCKSTCYVVYTLFRTQKITGRNI